MLTYALLSLVATWPAALHFGTKALGEHYFDRTQNIWNLWWVKTALFDLHTNPFHTDLLLYPQGADLYFHTLNFPSTLMSMPIQLLSGPVAAYNFSMLLAVTLSAYAGYRLGRYLTGSFPGALTAGLIFGFSPITFFQLRGHTQMVSMQWLALCIEFYLRAWNGHDSRPIVVKRDALVAGVFFVLALLTVGYYEVQLLLFFAVHAVWWLAVCARGGWGARFVQLLRSAKPALTLGLGTALLLSAPYLAGAWASLSSGQVVPQTADDASRAIADSADLLSFIVPDRDHWLLGSHMPWWGWINPGIHDLAYIGLVPLALAIIGVRSEGLRRTSLWVIVALLNLTLALGPVLRVNGQETVIPMPFALLQHVPVLSLVRAPERFMIAVYLALAVLAGYGVKAVVTWLEHKSAGQRYSLRAAPAFTGVIAALLLLEMPLHPQYTESLPVSTTINALTLQQAHGAVLEMPLTQHGWVDTNRMAYQIAHGRPITSGFLSRPVVDPYRQACSPLRSFTMPPLDLDIVPAVEDTQRLSILRESGFTHLLVYKQAFYNPSGLSPVPPGELSDLQSAASALGRQVADDDLATLYELNPTNSARAPYIQLGDGWHAPEESAGGPFRWMYGKQAELCLVNSPAGRVVLHFNVVSFATERHLQLWANGSKMHEAAVPADGRLHVLDVELINPAAGPQPVRIEVPEGSSSPASVGQGTDNRQLSLGFGPVTLEYEGP
jgi:hypothetical protein